MVTPNLRLIKTQRLIGHGQLTYKSDLGLVYCFQEYERGKVRFMRCSSDGEPSHEVKISNPNVVIEVPVFDEYDSNYTVELKILCRKWIRERESKNETKK
jgi:hypothetical protein